MRGRGFDRIVIDVKMMYLGTTADCMETAGETDQEKCSKHRDTSHDLGLVKKD